MKLWLKFSLLLSTSVLLTAAGTTFFQARFFAADQIAYLKDFQSTVALFAQTRLVEHLDALHTRWQTLKDRPADQLKRAPLEEGEVRVWRRGGAHYRHRELASLPLGTSPWTLVSSPVPSAIRWVGRYQGEQITVDLNRTWFSRLFEHSHSTNLQLVSNQGDVLFSSQQESIDGREVFHNPEIVGEMLKSSAAQTRVYRSIAGEEYVGTFIRLPSDPPVLVSVVTPKSVTDEVVQRTFLHTAWVGVVFLALAVLGGILFSRHLVAPLHALVSHSVRVADGKFDPIPVGSQRRDEVGTLSRSFGEMSIQLKSLQERLRSQERQAALGQFSAAIAHQIKNPLASILGNAQVASKKIETGGDPEKIKQALRFVETETLRANQIVTDLMKFARREKLPDETLDLGSLVKESLTVLKPTLKSKGILLDEMLGTATLLCNANRDQIREVIENLVHNACDAMEGSKERRLTLSLSRKDRLALLTVADTGAGISAEDLPHIFEPFFTTKRIGEGTGLGLSVCHGIVQNHQGSISVANRLGRGAEFTVALPLVAS